MHIVKGCNQASLPETEGRKYHGLGNRCKYYKSDNKPYILRSGSGPLEWYYRAKNDQTYICRIYNCRERNSFMSQFPASNIEKPNTYPRTESDYVTKTFT